MPGKIGALDGLRGTAALIVVVSHCMLAFFPYLHSGTATDLNADWQRIVFNSPFLALYSGGFSVSVFFVLSGYVLSRKHFQTGDTSWIPQAAAKRYLRLGIPVFAAVMLCFIWSTIGAFPDDRSGPAGSLIAQAYTEPMTILRALSDGIYGTLLLGHARFDYVLWTVQIEFFGSIALFGFLALFGRSRLCALYAAVLTGFLLFPSVNNGVHYACFFAGAFIHKWRVPSMRPFAPLIFALGFWLGGYHWQSSSYSWVAYLANQVQAVGIKLNWPIFIPAVGAVLLTWSLTFDGPMQRLFSRRPLRWLGLISFSLYLTHSFVLTTIGPVMFRITPAADYQLIAWLATGAVVVASLSVSVPFTYIDKFAIDVSNRFGTWNLLPEYDPADRLRVPAVVRSSEPRIKGDRRRSVVCNE